MLFCAGILGRYYSDWHDVDEDKVTVAHYAGSLNSGSDVGIFRRGLYITITTTIDIVASIWKLDHPHYYLSNAVL